MKRKSVKISLLFSICTYLCILLKNNCTHRSIVENEYDMSHKCRFSSCKSLESKERRPMKIIFLGNSFWRAKGWEVGLGSVPFKRLGCKMSECFITDNYDLWNVSEAVLWHIHELGEIPAQRYNYKQRWVFFMMESPQWSKNMNYARHWSFNWTMTYRLDSDLPVMHAKVTRVGQSMRNESPNMDNSVKRSRDRIRTRNSRDLSLVLQKKEKLVAWAVSRCHTPSKREKYVSELQKHIPVDIYGKCGTLKCPKDWTNHDTHCIDMISTKYKFYLAFENSICDDYLTEKFYKTLPYDIVPVLRGGAKYSKLLPADGLRWFIDSADFSSPQKLAEFLIQIDQDPERYKSYLQSRFEYEFESYFGVRDHPVWCDLCAKLHDDKERDQVYEDMVAWWKTGKCYHLQDY